MADYDLECGQCGEPLTTWLKQSDDVYVIDPCKKCGRKIRMIRATGTMIGRKPTIRTTNNRDPKIMCRVGRKKKDV